MSHHGQGTTVIYVKLDAHAAKTTLSAAVVFELAPTLHFGSHKTITSVHQ